MDHSYDILIEKIRQWSLREESIIVAMVVGSRARSTLPADQWSDLDLVFFVEDPARYIESEEWVGDIGFYWMSFVEHTAVHGVKERRVLFEEAKDVDFAFLPIHKWKEYMEMPEVQQVLSRGYNILIDKGGYSRELPFFPAYEDLSSYHPSESEWRSLVHDFWYHVVWAAKKLLRQELFVARLSIDGGLKHQLLTMSEWHAKALHDSGIDIWHKGRFFEQWADPRILKELENCFGRYHETDLWISLFKTADLFDWVAEETGRNLYYPYPEKGTLSAKDWLERWRDGRGL